MQRTPWASGGTSIESITTGGRSTPSIRGIEKPHTSASMTATLLAPLGERDGQVRRDRRLADAALARGDEQHAGAATTGRRTGSPGPRRDRGPAGDAGGRRRVAVQLLAERRALLVGHDGEVEATRCRRRRAALTAPVTRCWISLRSGQPGDGEGDEHAHVGSRRCATSRTMSRSTMLRCSSGSWTGRRASMTSASVRDMAPRQVRDRGWFRSPSVSTVWSPGRTEFPLRA